MFSLENLGKEEQINPKAIRIDKILKIGAKISDVENQNNKESQWERWLLEYQ
jgi:hypothetical protein